MDGKKFLQFPQRYLHSWSLWFITMRETKPLRDHSPPSCLIRPDISLDLPQHWKISIFIQRLFYSQYGVQCEERSQEQDPGDLEPLNTRSINTTQRPGTLVWSQHCPPAHLSPHTTQNTNIHNTTTATGFQGKLSAEEIVLMVGLEIWFTS